MKKVLKNKKGFSLVELLAVIVILALIMGIAVVAMSGVIGESQKNSARKTAASIIDGVRQKLMLEGTLADGQYYFTNAILERGGVSSALGGDYTYYTPAENEESVATGVYKTSGKTCSASATPYVEIKTSGDKRLYYICLPSGAGNDFVAGLESDILADKDSVIYASGTTAFSLAG